MNSIMIDEARACAARLPPDRGLRGGKRNSPAWTDRTSMDRWILIPPWKRLNLYKAEEAQASEHICRLTGGKR